MLVSQQTFACSAFPFKKEKVFLVIQENSVNRMDLLAVTSFSSHLPFGWKKVIKVFPVSTQQWIPYIFASIFIWGRVGFRKGWGTKEKE